MSVACICGRKSKNSTKLYSPLLYNTIKKEFYYYLNKGKSLYDYIFFDNASTSLTPCSVIEKSCNSHYTYAANPSSAAHELGRKSKKKIEDTRKKVRKFINAKKSAEIIFTTSSTHACNILALSLSSLIKKKDEILITHLEHSSNIVPWIHLAEKKKAKLKFIKLNKNNILSKKTIRSHLNKNTSIVSFSSVDNILGIKKQVKEIVKEIKLYCKKIIVVIDSAQWAPHHQIDVQKWGADFTYFSSHKMFGIAGTGILWGKENLLKKITPSTGGGGSIKNIENAKKIIYKSLPQKFESGTQNVASINGIGKAIDFINQIKFKSINEIESTLKKKMIQELTNINGIHIHSNSRNNVPIITFTIDKSHPEDIAKYLDNYKISVRSGTMCVPFLNHIIKKHSAVRVSLSIFNCFHEIDKFIDILKKGQKENFLILH